MPIFISIQCSFWSCLTAALYLSIVRKRGGSSQICYWRLLFLRVSLFLKKFFALATWVLWLLFQALSGHIPICQIKSSLLLLILIALPLMYDTTAWRTFCKRIPRFQVLAALMWILTTASLLRSSRWIRSRILIFQLIWRGLIFQMRGCLGSGVSIWERIRYTKFCNRWTCWLSGRSPVLLLFLTRRLSCLWWPYCCWCGAVRFFNLLKILGTSCFLRKGGQLVQRRASMIFISIVAILLHTLWVIMLALFIPWWRLIFCHSRWVHSLTLNCPLIICFLNLILVSMRDNHIACLIFHRLALTVHAMERNWLFEIT